jgi:uncharacterized protein (DUF433 family)
MSHTIQISEEIFSALQHQASQNELTPDALAELWLKQRLGLEKYPELGWRQGPSGWRVGIKNTAIDVYTVAGYSQAGYEAKEIANEILPRLTLQQVQSALTYYADHPAEIDQILAESAPEAVKARLYRTLGPKTYHQLTGDVETPQIVRESRAKYHPNDQD